MPRKAKRMQTPVAPQDQAYGQRGEQLAAQGQMGIPDNRQAPPFAAPAPAPIPAGAGAAPPRDPQAILDLLQSQPPPPIGGLARPTDRPDEAITQGLGTPQPPTVNKAADTFEMMAAVTGDERFKMMAARARSL